MAQTRLHKSIAALFDCQLQVIQAVERDDKAALAQAKERLMSESAKFNRWLRNL